MTTSYTFLAKGKKEDLRKLAEELGEIPTPEMKVADLKKIISENKACDEEFVKGMLDVIISTRLEEETMLRLEAQERKELETRQREIEIRQREIEIQQRKEELELQQRREQMEFELKKLEIESRAALTSTTALSGDKGQCHLELIKLMPKFRLQEDDIVIYLSLFERQAKRTKMDIKDWVSCLLTLLPFEIVQLVGRESEENCDNYEYIKAILLKRFKMNPESFRKKFVKHQKTPEKSWRDFCYEITSYFEEWISGLEVKDFEGLKNLMITDQLKKKVPPETRDHLLDEWAKFVSPTKLADRLDEYDSIHMASKKSIATNPRNKVPEKVRLPTPPPEPTFN